MKKYILLLILVLLLTGCVDTRKCKKSHNEIRMIPFPVTINGKTTITIRPIVMPVCDEYEDLGGNEE